MGYKLIAIDLDGTLLTSKKEISPATRESISQAYGRGIHIVISTGRSYGEAKFFSEQLAICSPVITANGAFVKVPERDEPLFQSPLGEELSLQILEICQRHRITPNFHTPQKIYYDNLIYKWILMMMGRQARLKPQLMAVEREYVAGFGQWRHILAKERDHIVKCVVLHINKEKVTRLRDELSAIDALEVVSSGANNLELTRKGVSKGAGLTILAQYYHLGKNEIMAIGDSENDLVMLETAGLGVAMGNGMDFIKAKADYITDTNDREGVAKAIQTFILN